MKKCCFIIPYYGKLPAQFSVFLKSCGWNLDFNWLIFTDDKTDYPYPENVRVVYNTLADFQTLADEKLGFPVRLEDCHKLCDLKPAYGFLFEEYLTEFLFWGYCDIDTVMGKLSSFLTEELLEQYDKLFCLGHLTMIRNTPELCRVFLSKHNGKDLYREVFSTPENCWFDEEYQDDNNVNQIFLRLGKRVCQKDLSLNIDIGSRGFRRTEYVGMAAAPENHGYRTEEYRRASYFWDHGHLLRMTEQNGELHTEEFLYMHLQYRTMEFDQAVLDADVFRIVPDRFVAMKAVPGNRLSYRLTPKYGYSAKRILAALSRRLHRA